MDGGDIGILAANYNAADGSMVSIFLSLRLWFLSQECGDCRRWADWWIGGSSFRREELS
ncbi:MAG: hypothetical protein GX629_12660 [Phycisphaerae bacterium]|nr:hypothetical protein [Phycisphaerae bacterium]